MEKKIIKLINSIRNSNPDAVRLYTNGECYNFALILRSMFNGEIFYSRIEGHVWFKYEGLYYDINGVCFNIPKDIELLDHVYGHRPHRWSRRKK